jgi:hypothetical protein
MLLVAVACNDDGSTIETRTVPPGTDRPLVQTGNPSLDTTITHALRRDRIELAGLTGYQQIACDSAPEDPARVPICRPNEEEGTQVEALPVTNCEDSLVRPEQVPDAYNIALAGSGADASVVAVYRPTPEFVRFGAQYIAVIRTNAVDEEPPRGAALHVFEGRVVSLETDCDDLASLYDAPRVAEWLVQP